MTSGAATDQVRLGTRGSQLAMWQTRTVAAALQTHHPDLKIDIVIIRTEGDRNRRDPLSQIGGQGVFVKEIEAALLRHDIDVAVHSMKDMPNSHRNCTFGGAGAGKWDVIGRDGQPLAAHECPLAVGTGSCAAEAWPSPS